MNEGDLAVEKGDDAVACREYGAAEAMAPGNLDNGFLACGRAGRRGQGKRVAPDLSRLSPGSERATLTPRLVKSAFLRTVSEADLRIILEQAP